MSCAVCVLLVAGGGLRLRERQLRIRFQIALSERTRLTRELHDTLLQGFAAVVYQLEAARRDYQNVPDCSTTKLERALELADDSLREARQTISFLRQPRIENSNLAEILDSTARSLTTDAGMAFHISVRGNPYQLSYDAQWNVYVVAREAIINSIRHSRSSQILLELSYEPKRFVMVIRDDGVGFAPEASQKVGRWGLHGMHERAAQMGGSLSIETAPGGGAAVTMELPRRHLRA